MNALGIDIGEPPLNFSSLLAVLACVLVWLFIWHTRWGYEVRTVGHSERAARYAGISRTRAIVLAMLISGALAGLVGVNDIMGVHHYLLVGWTGGVGFVGIAVALMGRNHPVGIAMAALLVRRALSGRLGDRLRHSADHQGDGGGHPGPGDPVLRRAREHVQAADRRACSGRRAVAGGRLMDADWLSFLALIASTIRLVTPLILAALAGLFAERSGIVDIALEGKMLAAAAFAAAATAAVTGSAWLGLGAGIVDRHRPGSAPRPRQHPLQRQSGRLRHGAQHPGGGPRRRPSATPGSSQGGRDAAAGAATRASATSRCRARRRSARSRSSGRSIVDVISGHNIIVLIWPPSRCRWCGGSSIARASASRLRAAGENPHALDTAGVSVAWVRYRALVITGVLCGIAGSYLSIAHNAGFVRDMTAGKGYLALAALVFGKWRPLPTARRLPAVRLRRCPADPPAGRRACRWSAGCPCSSSRPLPYILTVLLLAGFVGRAIAPKASGIPM